MKKEVQDIKGKKVGEVSLSDSVFSVDVNNSVISQYIYSYLSNQRQGNAHTKNRAEVRGGGKKPWRQKGTGRARFGSSRVPIWRKGGVAFGPRNTVNHKKVINKNFKKAALRHILSDVCKNNLLTVVESVDLTGDKLTKQAESLISLFSNKQKRFTVVTSEKKEDVMNAFSNIDGARVITAKDLNGYDLVAGGSIVFEKDAIEYINSKLEKKDVSSN